MAGKRKKITLFILEDDPDYQKLLKKYLGNHFSLTFAKNLSEAFKLFSEEASLAIVDICLDNNNLQNKDGLKFITHMGNQGYSMPVIVLSGYAQEDVPEVVANSFKSGAIDYLMKSKITPTFLIRLVNDALDRYSLRNQVNYWKRRVKQIESWEMIGECAKIKSVKQAILQVAEDGYASVLITGETGTGKELVANAIHQKGWRKEAPFTSFSVAALPRELIQRELFGHERGAYTGADQAKPGYIETTQGGVLFLDEVPDIPLDVQGMLLRILEERKLCRIGSTRSVKVDFQLVCATNKDIGQAVKNGKFRADLYYRLNTFQIHLPPLRERGEDILLIAGYFLDHLRKRGRVQCNSFSPDVLKAFMKYPWPGNIRELKNVIEGAAIKSKSFNTTIINTVCLPAELKAVNLRADTVDSETGVETEAGVVSFPIDLKRERTRSELHYIEMALKSVKGKKTEAWKILGLSNRYALKRRVDNHLEAFPDLFGAFPYLKSCYGIGDQPHDLALKTDRK